MTNAMCQSFAMLLFFWAIALARKCHIKSLLLGVLAVAAHLSVIAYFPLLVWMVGVQLSRKFWLNGVAVILLSVGAIEMIALLGDMRNAAGYLSEISEMCMMYSEQYAGQSNVLFTLFMALPLYFVYGLRWVFERKNITPDEQKAFVYSTGVLLFSYLFIPAILYRFSMFAVALQIFLAFRSERHSYHVGGVALVGFIVHLLFITTTTDHYTGLFYG